MKLTYFKDIDFLQAIKGLFKELKVPVNYVADEPTSAQEILKDTYKDNSTFALVDDVYFVGMVDDAAFEQNVSLAVDKIRSDYDGVLIFGITLHPRENNLLPTRSQLAEISRAFNREFYYTPVVLVYKYKGENNDFIAFANTERLKYKQTWREGEKAGKVSLLRDIDIEKPHRGHEDIINQLKIPTSGKNQVDSFAKLYNYWQDVFNVNVLNKKFYQELSNWYFWAIRHVTFPNKPTIEDAHLKGVDLDSLVQEHNAKNVIRLLTRLLFTWFIKEKKLIPEDLFDLASLQQDILKDISPYHDENSLFSDANQDSVYYKAILQNLFFASLNCPIEADRLDNRTRGFRGLETYGKHRGIDWMMRYKNHFKNPDKFLKMMNQTVPFLNGGLFECLDDKTQNLYLDGFSDQMTKGEKLVVPDYLFFGVEEKVDLSTDYGVKNKAAKEAVVKGLINILKSYKFTITENTPIEEDVALDPELLGKVFENLLASYNPETKTTARKQTGSFYTPREIVNYMVDESLIAYLKNAITEWDNKDEQLDKDLHQLFSFDTINPFAENDALQKQIIRALDKCTILDPACGSGAFPMGALQKMVHVLGKIDSNNEYWQDLQLEKAQKETEGVFTIQDKKEREQLLLDINDTFDEALNNPDYARKLYLIENCIYGVDIQSIATQISKLRFFISLVVDQKINPNKENFGIRPLPNLETKFVAANTLIGIDKPSDQLSLYDTQEVKALENELKKIRHKLFSAKTKDTKLKYRQKDEELRNAIAEELVRNGWANDTAEKLAGWNPYDQNASSPFFDPEWMFDIKSGFDVVIGNPPYLGHKEIGSEKQKEFKKIFGFTDDMYNYFYHRGMDFLAEKGTICYITPNTYLTLSSKSNLRKLFLDYYLKEIFLVGYVFNQAYVDTVITLVEKTKQREYQFNFRIAYDNFTRFDIFSSSIDIYFSSPDNIFYPPSVTNIYINDLFGSQLKQLYNVYGSLIKNQKKAKKSHVILNTYRKTLKEGSVTTLGLLSEGAQGLVTGNNSKYLGIVCDTITEQDSITQDLCDKLSDELNVKVIDKSPYELWKTAEAIKSKHSNPSFFGKFFLYKTVLRENVRYFSDLTPIEQSQGINGADTWVFYSRGNDAGYRWNVPFVEAIAWSETNVKELKEGIVTNSRWQGSDFYSETGFGWVDYFTNQLKAFFVEEGPYSKNVVKFHSISNLSDLFFTSIINSKLATYYVKNFITNTHTLQINDGKMIPIVYPSEKVHGIISIISQMIINTLNTVFQQVVDSVILNLYFPEHMTEKAIDIIDFVEQDLSKILQDRDYGQLNEIEKEEVIEQLHLAWSHPDNEVRNRIKLFAVRSPEILKPILES